MNLVVARLRAVLAVTFAVVYITLIVVPTFILAAMILPPICLVFGLRFRRAYLACANVHGIPLVVILLWILGVQATIRIGNETVPLARMREHVAATTIVYANHQSLFDIPLLCLVMFHLRRFALEWVMKEDLRWTPFGMAGSIGGCIFVSRQKEQSSQDLQRMIAGARRARDSGLCVMIFPEGTRFTGPQVGSSYRRVRRPKRGGFATLLRELPEASVLSCTVSWRGGKHESGFGRTFWDALDFVGKRVEVSAELVPRAVIDADPDYLEHDFAAKDAFLQT